MRRVTALILAVVLMGGAMLPIFISAADVSVASAFTFWTGGKWFWSYEVAGQQFSFVMTPYSATLDWKLPFPASDIVSQGYVNSSNQGIKLELSSVLPSNFYNYRCTINFEKPMKFVGGMRYQFMLRVSQLELFNNGNAASFSNALTSVTYEDDNAATGSMALVRSAVTNYDDCYSVTFAPSTTVSVNTLYFGFTRTDSTLTTYNGVHASFAFSNMVCYTGDLDYVNTNPQLNSIEKQITDIKDYIGTVPDHLAEWEETVKKNRFISGMLNDQHFNNFPPIPSGNVGASDFIVQAWGSVGAIGDIGIPFRSQALEWLCFGDVDRVFRVRHFVAWFTSIFATQMLIRAISARVKDKNNPVQGDGDD